MRSKKNVDNREVLKMGTWEFDNVVKLIFAGHYKNIKEIEESFVLRSRVKAALLEISKM